MIREIELKYRLHARQDYQKLANYFDLSDDLKFKQVNYFFDTKKFSFKKNKVTLRLREQEGKFVMTAKNGNINRSTEGRDVLVVRLESESAISSDKASKIISKQLNPLQAFIEQAKKLEDDALKTHKYLQTRFTKCAGTSEVISIGSFINFRLQKKLRIEGFEVVFELDETHFPNGLTHYEAEVEIPEHVDTAIVKKHMRQIFKEVKLETFPDKGKSTRFYETLLN